MEMYDNKYKTKGNKNRTNDKIEPEQIHFSISPRVKTCGTDIKRDYPLLNLIKLHIDREIFASKEQAPNEKIQIA